MEEGRGQEARGVSPGVFRASEPAGGQAYPSQRGGGAGLCDGLEGVAGVHHVAAPRHRHGKAPLIRPGRRRTAAGDEGLEDEADAAGVAAHGQARPPRPLRPQRRGGRRVRGADAAGAVVGMEQLLAVLQRRRRRDGEDLVGVVGPAVDLEGGRVRVAPQNMPYACPCHHRPTVAMSGRRPGRLLSCL